MHPNSTLKKAVSRLRMEISPTYILNALWILGCVTVFQVLAIATLISSFHRLKKETSELLKETHGCMRKIEGLTASRREAFVKQYEKLHEQLTTRVPITVASHASTSIFEAEKKILTRLAELEPQMKADPVSLRKFDDLIRTMEDLEQTIVTLTAESVKKVLHDSRGDFLAEEESLAA